MHRNSAKLCFIPVHLTAILIVILRKSIERVEHFKFHELTVFNRILQFWKGPPKKPNVHYYYNFLKSL